MGKKEYGDFVEKLRKSLQEEMDLKEDKIFFQSKAPGITESGDRLLIECAEWDVGKEICAVHTCELYESYLEGRKLKSIVHDVKEEMKRLKNSGMFEKVKNLDDFEKIKDDLFIRLVSADREREGLKSVVSRIIGDVAQVLYLRLAEEDDFTTSMKIQKSQVKYWGMNENVVFEMALMNTMRTYPPRIFRWEGLIYDRDYRGEAFMAPVQIRDVNFRRTAMGNCLSTSHRTNGAVAIFYPGVTERLAQMMGQDLYLVFTSVHEVMVHSASQCEVENLETALWATLRETTPESEWLTTRIYRYCRATNNIICVSDGRACPIVGEEDVGDSDTDDSETAESEGEKVMDGGILVITVVAADNEEDSEEEDECGEEEVKSEELKSEEPKSEEPKSEEGKDEDGKDEDGKDEEGKDEDGKDEDGKDEEGKDKEGKGEEAKNEEPGNNDPKNTKAGSS